jgi:type IV pilus assembly protein PilE
MPPRTNRRGFTLLEAMIALAIVAILAAIAWPGYRQLMHRSQRIEARLALMRVQFLQERYFADHHVYASELRTDGNADSLPMASITDDGNYELSMTLDAERQAYVAIARANASGRQTGDSQCQQLSIDTIGARRSASADGVWRQEPAAGCWS